MTFTKKHLYLFIIVLILPPFTIFGYFTFGNNYSYSSNKIFVLAYGTPDVDLDDLPKIKYKWQNSKIEMLIITPDNQSFVDAVTPLMEWKNEKGVKTIILSNFADYNGTDGAERIRNMIKTYYEKENIQWVLLCGDAQNDSIPIKYVYNPDVIDVSGNSEYSTWDDYYKPTDFYYADLTGSWNDNGNDRWGESAERSDYKDEIAWTPDVYVGRFPADNALELGIMVNKTLKYEKYPFIGDWMHQMLLAGGISDPIDIINDPDGEDESRLTTYILQHYTKSDMDFTHLWNSVSFIPPDPKEPLTVTSFIQKFNDGYSTVIFAGHGAPKVFEDIEHQYYNLSEAQNSGNDNMPSLVYVAACTTAPYDIIENGPQNDDNIGEVLIKRNNSGAIGFIGGLRATWYLQDDEELEKLNRGNANLFWKEFFEEKKFQQGKALYDSKISYMESDYFTEKTSINFEYQRKNILSYCLLGDPEVDIYTDKPKEVKNSFTEKIYEGQLVSVKIYNSKSERVPYARVHLRTDDGKYRTVYADENGKAKFRVPAEAELTYNVVITGHNLVPSYFNFETHPDNDDPEFLDSNYSPKNPSVSDRLCFTAEAKDSESELEGVFLLKSTNDFKDYEYFRMSNSSQDDEDIFEHTLNKLDPGEYSFLIVARDWAGNTEIFNKNFEITIPIPLMNYVLITASIMILCVAGISVFVGFKEIRKFSQTLKRLAGN